MIKIKFFWDNVEDETKEKLKNKNDKYIMEILYNLTIP